MATGRTRSSLSVETVRSTSTFSDTINRIVLRIACVESREESSGKANGNNEAGPLSAVELAELSMLCAQQSQRPSEGFCTVEGDQLLALLELLDRHINNAVGLNFVQAAVDCCSKEAPGSVVSSVLDSVSFLIESVPVMIPLSLLTLTSDSLCDYCSLELGSGL